MQFSEKQQSKSIELTVGSRIAVIGGGPAGSFFSYFTLDLANRYGIQVEIDIYEAKEFSCCGGAGCNRCGGIISETLVQQLSANGIVLPPSIIRRGIETYTMHLEQGAVTIETPLHEQRIASVYRGSGPQGDIVQEQESFDGYLLELCRKKGANIIHDRVIQADRLPDGILIKTKGNQEKKYDLVVGASGLNPKTLKLFQSVCPDYIPPKTTRTYISEIYLERKSIDRIFGHSMHIFLLNLKNISFGALIPKGKYVTLVLLGSDIGEECVSNFLNSDQVKSCFPENIDIESVTPCKCFPSINVSGAHHPFSDRLVFIGDSASSKLYKNGIGAAYQTARAAAKTVIFEGISKENFQDSYAPVCKELDRDNDTGKLIFHLTGIVQKSKVLKYGIFQMVMKEQSWKGSNRYLSSILWDTFTGSASYRSIFLRFMNPVLILLLIWNTITANLHRSKFHKNDKQ